jgi:hypothetical protein
LLECFRHGNSSVLDFNSAEYDAINLTINFH